MDGKRLILIFMLILFLDVYVSNFSQGLGRHFTLPSWSCDKRLIVAVSKLLSTWSITSEQSICRSWCSSTNAISKIAILIWWKYFDGNISLLYGECTGSVKVALKHWNTGWQHLWLIRSVLTSVYCALQGVKVALKHWSTCWQHLWLIGSVLTSVHCAL